MDSAYPLYTPNDLKSVIFTPATVVILAGEGTREQFVDNFKSSSNFNT